MKTYPRGDEAGLKVTRSFLMQSKTAKRKERVTAWREGYEGREGEEAGSTALSMSQRGSKLF